MTLTKDNSTIMRGLAISSIVLHNFIHMPRFGFTAENEFIHTDGQFDLFLASLTSGGLFHAAGEILSFLGWMGVPVFVFLSGYGLTQKYESGKQPPRFHSYIWHSWRKLFLLLLPVTLIFLLIHLGDWSYLGRSMASLTLLANLAAVYPPTHVYWYFGLTFELYLLYLSIYRIKDWRVLLGMVLVVWGLQITLVTLGKTEAIDWNMHNFLGWIPEFVLGVVVGRYSKTSFHLPTWGWMFVAVFSAGMMVLGNANAYLWIFIRLFAISFFASMAMLVGKTPVIRDVFIHIGTISAFLFAIHPLARTLASIILPLHASLCAKTALYVLMAYLGAIAYRIIHKKYLSGFLKYPKVS